MTQLRTFGWARVPERVQAAVAAQAERERKLRAFGSGGKKEMGKGKREERDGGGDEGESVPESMSSSGHLTPMHSSVHSLAPSRASSHSSARTAIPLGGTAAVHPLPAPLGGESLIATEAALKAFRPKVILHPNKASGVESKYLDVIAEEIERTEGRESADAWTTCLGFFDGEHALETIAVREGWKRKRVEGFRAAWVKMGVLVEVRHW